MKIGIAILTLLLSLSSLAQSPAQKVYETERAFEKMVAEKGLNAGFIEYLAPDGIMFFPEPENARARLSSRPPSPAALTWNPILIDVASNGVLAYSIGNSVVRPGGKNDAKEIAGHYLSVWMRQANGEYRAVLDTGIHHEKTAATSADWKAGSGSGDPNIKRISAADSSTGFYLTAADNVQKAYKSFLAADAIVMRDGSAPFVGKSAALDALSRSKGTLAFAKRKAFIEAPDLAYVHSGYSVRDKAGTEVEKGNFVQVWKFRNGRWQIVADVLVAIPNPK